MSHATQANTIIEALDEMASAPPCRANHMSFYGYEARRDLGDGYKQRLAWECKKRGLTLLYHAPSLFYWVVDQREWEDLTK